MIQAKWNKEMIAEALRRYTEKNNKMPHKKSKKKIVQEYSFDHKGRDWLGKENYKTGRQRH